MGLPYIPQLLDAGTLALTAGTRKVEGDTDTLANVAQGQDLLVVGHQGVWTVANDAADDGGGDGDFKLLREWANASGSAQGYVAASPMTETARKLCASVDAIGAFSGRATHNAEAEGYLYLSTDGVGSATEPVIYVRATATAGVWRPLEEAEAGNYFPNPVLNPQFYVTDPYIDADSKSDAEPLQRAPWFALVQAGTVDESDATSDASFRRGIKLTKKDSSGRAGVAQAILKSEAPHLFDRPLTIVAKVRNDNGSGIRAALISDTGTAKDPKDLVNDWASTTWTPGNFFASSDSLVVEATESVSIAAGDTNFVALSVPAAVSASATRLFLTVWHQDSMAIDETLEITEVAIKPGGGASTVFQPQTEEETRQPVRQSYPQGTRRNKIVNPEAHPTDWRYGYSKLADREPSIAAPWYAICSSGDIDLGGTLLGQTISALEVKANATQRIGAAQLLDDYDLEGVQHVLTATIDASKAMTIRYAVLDGVFTETYPDVVADWSLSDFTPNNFFNFDVVVLGMGTIAANTDVQEIVPLEVAAINSWSPLVVCFWTEDEVAAGDWFRITNARMESGTIPTVPEYRTSAYAHLEAGKMPPGVWYPMWAIASAGAIAPAKNLVVKNNATTPNSKIDVDADRLVFLRADGIDEAPPYYEYNVNLTLDMATDLDEGTEASNTWYYIWVLWDGSYGGTIGRFSTSASSPTFEEGYQLAALVGAVYNNASGNLVSMHQIDKHVVISPVTYNPALVSSYTAQSLATAAPAIAQTWSGFIKLNASTATPRNLLLAPLSSGSGLQRMFGYFASGSGQQYQPVNHFPLIEDQTVYYRLNATSNIDDVDIVVSGWSY